MDVHLAPADAGEPSQKREDVRHEYLHVIHEVVRLDATQVLRVLEHVLDVELALQKRLDNFIGFATELVRDVNRGVEGAAPIASQRVHDLAADITTAACCAYGEDFVPHDMM